MNNDTEMEKQNAAPTNEEIKSVFLTLQEQMDRWGSSKTEFKMLRPDGYTWVLTVLPPDHPNGLKAVEEDEDE